MVTKKILTTLFVVGMAISVVGAGVAFGEKTETWTARIPLPMPRVVTDRPLFIGFGGPDMTPESCQRDWLQTQIEVAHRGWRMTHVLDAETHDAQRDVIQGFINMDVDAIVILYFDMEPLRDLIIEARNKGIGVYGVDTELKPGCLVNTTQPNGVVGAQIFYYGLARFG